MTGIAMHYQYYLLATLLYSTTKTFCVLLSFCLSVCLLVGPLVLHLNAWVRFFSHFSILYSISFCLYWLLLPSLSFTKNCDCKNIFVVFGVIVITYSCCRCCFRFLLSCCHRGLGYCRVDHVNGNEVCFFSFCSFIFCLNLLIFICFRFYAFVLERFGTKYENVTLLVVKSFPFLFSFWNLKFLLLYTYCMKFLKAI